MLESWAQDGPSLQRQVQTTSGLAQLRARNDLAMYYLKQRPDQAFLEAGRVLKDAPKIKGSLTAEDFAATLDGIIKEEARAHYIIGTFYEGKKSWKKASRSFQLAINTARKIGDQPLIAQASQAKRTVDENRRINGLVQQTISSIDEIVKTGTEEASRAKTAVTANTLHLLGEQAEKAQSWEDAIKFFRQEVDLLLPTDDTTRLKKVYRDLVRVYEKAGDYGQAAHYLALASGGRDVPSIAPPVASTDTYAVEGEQEILVEAFQAIVSAGGQTNRPPEVPVSAETEAIRERLQQNLASGNRDGALADLDEFLALKDRLYLMRQDSMEREKIVETYMNEITIFEQEQRLLMRDRQLLILGFSLVLGIGGLLAYLFFTKRKSNQQLQQANTDLAETLDQLKETQTQLVSAEKMASLGQLTAGIAHEINNPVNFISGNIQPLKQDVADLQRVLTEYEAEISRQNLHAHFQSVEELKQSVELDYITQEINELIGGIDEGASRTTEIVLGLRNFARLDEDQRKRFDLITGLDNTLSILRSQLKDIEVIKDYQPIPQIDGYPGKLNQVFMNVLTNAIQAMPSGGILKISTSTTQKEVEVRIQDTGKGMSQEVIARVFEPFFTTKEVGEGTGLGMSISHGIIEQHDGSISLNSTVGQGTEVVIRLPIQ